MIPDRLPPNSLPNSAPVQAANKWSSLLPSDASSLKMIALCDWIKTFSQPIGFGVVGQVAKTTQLSLTGIRILTQAKSGELKTTLDPGGMLHEDSNVRVKFWRTLSLTCMLANDTSHLFFGKSKEAKDQSQFLEAMQKVGKFSVLSMDVSRTESFKQVLNELFNYSEMLPSEKLAKITEAAIFSISIAKVLMPSDPNITMMIGLLSSSLGVIKAFSLNLAPSSTEKSFEILKTKIAKKLDLKIPRNERELKVKGQQRDPSQMIYEKTNFAENLKNLKETQNEIDLYLELDELMQDLFHFKESEDKGEFAVFQQDALSASDIDMLSDVKKLSVKGVFSKIEKKNVELLAFKIRLEILYEALELLIEHDNGKNRRSQIETVLNFLRTDIERIDSLSAVIENQQPLEKTCSLTFSSTEPGQFARALKLTAANGFNVNLSKWLIDAEELTDPRYEQSIDETIATISFLKSKES